MQPVSVLMIAAADHTRDAMEATLRQNGCHVLTSENAALGIERALVHLPDVVLVSPHLQDSDSLDVCQKIRSQIEDAHEPVIVMIPASRDPLAVSTDDSMTRSIDLAQFAQAISTLANSTSVSSVTTSQLSTQGLQLDRKAFRASIDDRELRLTITEFNVLWLLARNAGSVLSRRDLCDECREDPSDPPCRSVDVHVRSLRQKLGDRADLVETVRGIGYRMRERSHEVPVCAAPVTPGGCC